MPMPHRTFAAMAKRRLIGKEGSARTREIRALLTELPDYRNGPYADLRKWLMDEVEETRVRSNAVHRDSIAVRREGAAQIALVGPPNVGKSSLLSGGLVQPGLSLPVLAAWESVIGIGLILNRWMRGILFLLAVQMAGTFTPLVLFPDETFSVWPVVPTLEGQYIIKNIVLIGAAMVVGATVRGGGLVAEPSGERAPEVSAPA